MINIYSKKKFNNSNHRCLECWNVGIMECSHKRLFQYSKKVPLFQAVNSILAKKLLIILLFFVLFFSSYVKAQSDTIQTDVPQLKNVFANDFTIGCLLSYPHIGFPDDPPVPGQGNVVAPNGGYLIKFHMNSMSPGNNMKPQNTVDINASATAYNSATTDEERDSIDVHPVVRFNGNMIAQLNWAERQGFTFRGHTLVWHNQTPGTAFFRTGYSATAEYLTKEKMTERMENYIKEIIRLLHEDWPGMLSAMDVVNEAVNDNGTDRTANNEWYTVFGDNTFIMKAFEFTRKYTIEYGETQMKLYYNDYSTHLPAKADGIVRVCQPIFEAGYLDGIGMQDHDQLSSPSAEQWIASYNKFDSICTEMSVTELDVNPGGGTPTPAILQTQANQYAQLFKCFVERSYRSGRGKIINVSKDGLNDQYAFVANASLWDSQNKCKPAFFAVVDVGISYNILDSLVTMADTLNESEYTPESWGFFSEALSSAKTAIEQNYSSTVSAAEALLEAKNNLVDAIEGLISTEEFEARKPIIVEAESGEAGSDFNTLQDDTISYVAIQTNFINTGNPGNTNRIITYEVNFPDTGTYNFFARIRVGANGFDDDSFFYGNGFGEKDSSNDDDWIIVNGLAAAGFSEPNEVVLEAGGLGSEIWKWVNLSMNAYQGEAGLTFTIEDSLTRIFQIGAREDGLDIDKIAFSKSYLYYTVGNLDNGEPGSTDLPGGVWEGPPLASNQPKFVGNIYSPSQVENFEAYWNQVTPENAGKWGSVEGTRDVMNWGALDAAYNLAKDNGFPFHFHVLVWGSQQPGWISSLSSEEQLEEITEWFEAVAERYPDIEFLEVVNEPLPGHNPPDGGNGRANYKDALGGDGETGWDWVLNAFRMARQIFPAETKLMLNDFSIINSSGSTAQYLNIIRLLQAENLIDIIGEQGHAFTTTASVATMRTNLDSLASTGLPIQITELDIDGTDDQVQLQSYQRIFPALYEHSGVEGITLWGWRRGLWRDAQGAYITNQDGSERPALEWLREYLDTVNVTVSVATTKEIPQSYKLYNNYPNPFNPTTQIQYSIPQSGYISLKVYNLLGQEVMTLFEGFQQTGNHIVMFSGDELAGGVYLYRLQSGNFTDTKKFILLK